MVSEALFLKEGTPANIETCIPDFFKLFAMSDDPVKSSPIIPSIMFNQLYSFCFSSCVTIFSLTQGVTSSLKAK